MQTVRKRFGQHYLHDQNVIANIVRALDPDPHDSVVEIGPGRGALTWPLLQRCNHLIAIEIDRDLVPKLQAKAKGRGQLTVINADILEFDLGELDRDPLRLVGNLPYNISTPLMFHLLQAANLITDMHFMLQQEVAHRIVAKAGEAGYGRLSVMLQFHCDCSYLFKVSPRCFAPPPQVDSAVVRMVPLRQPRVDVGNYQTFTRVVRTAFGQRRKTIANALKPIMDRARISDCGINPKLRAENLTLADFASLSRCSSA